jgi:hypothetical protein
MEFSRSSSLMVISSDGSSFLAMNNLNASAMEKALIFEAEEKEC